MINRSHGLSLSRQAQLVGISRGCLYYQRKPPCKAQVQLMHRIDALHATPPVCRLSHAAQLAQAPRPMCGPSACSHADAAHGRACAVLPAEHQCSPPTAQGLSLLAQEQACGLFQPSLGHGHHLRAHAQGLAVPVCRGRLVQPQGAGMEAVQHHGRTVLRRCSARGHRPLGDTCHLQHRPGQPIYKRYLHHATQAPWDSYLHGWQGRLAGQRLCRAPVALHQARGDLSQSL